MCKQAINNPKCLEKHTELGLLGLPQEDDVLQQIIVQMHAQNLLQQVYPNVAGCF